jgi:hypothetical protein
MVRAAQASSRRQPNSATTHHQNHADHCQPLADITPGQQQRQHPTAGAGPSCRGLIRWYARTAPLAARPQGPYPARHFQTRPEHHPPLRHRRPQPRFTTLPGPWPPGTPPRSSRPPPTWPASSAAFSSPQDLRHLAPASRPQKKSTSSTWPGKTSPHNHESRGDLLLKRVPGFTDSFVYLVYALSGGLPRELIRVTRRLVEGNQKFASTGRHARLEDLAFILVKKISLNPYVRPVLKYLDWR